MSIRSGIRISKWIDNELKMEMVEIALVWNSRISYMSQDSTASHSDAGLYLTREIIEMRIDSDMT